MEIEKILNEIEEYTSEVDPKLKEYIKENPENMFLEDDDYREFLKDMRELLKHEKEFKDKYCEINHIKSRQNRVCDEPGELEYSLPEDVER